MFNLSSDKTASPITAAQSAYLAKLVFKHGKAKYQQAKQQVGIPAETTILRLSKAQAARLIRFLIVNGGQR